MRLHIVTIGKPKLAYAQIGWSEYFNRLKRQHTIRATQLHDKFAGDAHKILDAAGDACKVALLSGGDELTSAELAGFLSQREFEGREVCFMIGGPEGLPPEVIQHADYVWSLGKLTLPHDLAMVVVLEALYRASTINAGLPYHK